ncbi:hypothetical protein T10_2495, partial [Trichinella papuae]
LKGMNPNSKAKQIDAYCVNRICDALEENPPVTWERVKDLNLADDFPRDRCEVDVLIGMDYYYHFIEDDKRVVDNGCLVAVKSTLGWILCGQDSRTSYTNTVKVLRIDVQPQCDCEQYRRFWELESIGIMDQPEVESPIERSMTISRELLSFHKNRYVTRLFWKNHDALPNNYHAALKRFVQLEVRLRKEPSKKREYENTLREYIDNGYVEEVESLEGREGKTWYLPHHAVFKMDKNTSKCRIVFDGSHRCEGVSLNERLDPGPPILADLVGIILRFRQFRIGIHADITKMFLQIGLHLEDRDVTRFLWRKHGEDKPSIYRFCRLPFGLCCSPYLAMSAVQDLAVTQRTAYPETVNEVLRNMYVDDILLSCDDESRARKMIVELTNMLKIGSFELSKWASNCISVLPLTSQSGVPPNCSKTLGMNWEHSTDTFHFMAPKESEIASCNTKRSLLSVVFKIFDPLGWLSPFVVRVKILLQRLWQQGVAWDETLHPPEELLWRNWKAEVMSLSRIQIPRCIVPSKQRIRFELHAFCDASKTAYGGVVYLRTVCSDGEISTKLVMSKSRVAPIKRVTIPRLELIAALVSARLVTYVGKQLSLKIDEITCWSDSEVALSWIKSPAIKWKTFVRNRVESIQQLTEASMWHYCPTRDNPADMLSRGCSLKKLEESQLWWNGPPWLSLPAENWPRKSIRENESKIISRAEARDKTTALTVSVIKENDRLDPSRFSNFEKLVRITAFCFRFFRNLKLPRHERKSAELSVEELAQAENFWLMTVQREAFEKERAAIQSGRNPVGKLATFNPYLDENGLIRVGGRLRNSDMDTEKKHPVLLPSTHPVVMLLIRRAHEQSLHSGTEQSLAELRQRFWVLKGRSSVKKIVRQCRTCQRQSTRPYEPIMKDLPTDRVTVAAPFERIGIDFAGPVYIKKRKNHVKTYICLFTCMVTRAIHLELVTSMTAKQFLHAFHRFAARRGYPALIQSDNFKTFKQADRELQELFNENQWSEIRDALTANRIKWKYITERAPWNGGYWERIIRTVKESLKRVLGNTLLEEDELRTVLCEIEARVNSRPLTFIGEDPRDPNPLTPFHFLIGREFRNIHEIHHGEDDDPTYGAPTSNELSRRWRYRRTLVNNFWKRWKNEYVVNLSQRKKWVTNKQEPRVGDIVLVAEDGVPTHKWPMARVIEVYPGDDGVVRTVKVKTLKGTYNRPVRKLRLLEPAVDSDGLRPSRGENVTDRNN